ncbi:MAG: hypothetical protein GY950_34860 [bacterium]|nr:hypothetical protein [bacterium]
MRKREILPVERWERKFKKAWKKEDERFYDNWSKWQDSSWYYFLAYGIDGNTAMYEATGNTEYLDRALYYVNNVVKDAKPSSSFEKSQYKDRYLGWITLYTGKANLSAEEKQIQFTEIPLYESYLWRYVTRLLRVIRQTPALYENPAYRNQYKSLLDFTEVNIFEKWFARGAQNIYRTRTHMASHWAFIALNLGIIGEYEPMKKHYGEIRDKINEDLLKQINPNSVDHSAYHWHHVWDRHDRPGQDVSHGNNVVSYMVEAESQGVFWDRADVSALVNLVLKVLWNKSEEEPDFADFFDGSAHSRHTGVFQSDGFVKLGRYDRDVQRLYEVYYQVESGRSGGPKQRNYNTQSYAHGALNAKILKG